VSTEQVIQILGKLAEESSLMLRRAHSIIGLVTIFGAVARDVAEISIWKLSVEEICLA
jgi:hypothetical protein